MTFRPIHNHPRYSVSEDGVVRGPRKTLKPMIHQKGYLYVDLKNNGKRKSVKVHTLVLETFVGPRQPGQQTRHLNNDRTDNRLCNLKWGTPKENSADRKANGRPWFTEEDKEQISLGRLRQLARQQQGG